MNAETYDAIWLETEKAFEYLYKKGCAFVTSSEPSGFGETVFSVYEFCGTDEKMRKHVQKRYPNAKITFVDSATIERKKRYREADFYGKYGRHISL